MCRARCNPSSLPVIRPANDARPAMSTVHAALQAAILGYLADQGVATQGVRVLNVDEADSVGYLPLAGLRAAWELLTGDQADGGTLAPLLLVGLVDSNELRAILAASEDAEILRRTLDTPGVAYLQFGFTPAALARCVQQAREELALAAARRSDAPPEPDDVLHQCSSVIHWAKGRLSSSEGAALVFEEAIEKGARLHPSWLQPVSAMKADTEKMVARLLASEAALAESRSAREETLSVANAVRRFERTWHELEISRLRCKGEVSAPGSPGEPDAIRMLATRQREVSAAVEQVMAAVTELALRARYR